MAFMSGYHIHLITFYLPSQMHLWFLHYDALAKLGDHLIHVILVQV
jgi:hypothetical protein